MDAALFTGGPYIDMSISGATMMSPTIEDGIVTRRIPVGNVAVPFVALQDCGYYVRWMFGNPRWASGIDLRTAIAHISFHEMAAAFERVTGRPDDLMKREYAILYEIHLNRIRTAEQWFRREEIRIL
ncbi:hypothetical protein J3F84DRAFT_402562 [Trichoderma pleuroticola]